MKSMKGVCVVYGVYALLFVRVFRPFECRMDMPYRAG